jgi:hypothetical protein
MNWEAVAAIIAGITLIGAVVAWGSKINTHEEILARRVHWIMSSTVQETS